MALTNFAKLTTEQKTAWAMDVWKNARNWSFLTRYLGSGADAMVQRVSELRKSEKGARAVITLVPDSEGDGIAGDRTLKGNEEALTSQDQVIRIDQLRNAHKKEGRMADQKSIVNFRKEARDNLAYWLADRIDQAAFLTLSGVAYTKHNTGEDRVGSDLPFLEFAADVTAPTAYRHLRWDDNGSGSTSWDGSLVENASTADVVAQDLPSLRMLYELKAYAQNNYVKPIRGQAGMEFYHVFMTPTGIAKLKRDPDFMSAWREAMPRSPNNPIFKGTDTIWLDGLAIHSYRHVYNTRNATSGVDKWGSGADVDGQRVLMCGAQALGYADIGNPFWVEEVDDYENQLGISVGKIFGFKKPVFYNPSTKTDEDFGVIVCDTAI